MSAIEKEQTELRAPFVWFGGKRKVAAEVWRELGDVDNYVEPFAGSLAVLLGRPQRHGNGRRRAETVNDKDMFLANFWRAVHADADAVAEHCDWPVNECDLFARHLWLVNEGREQLVAGLESDPEWCDPKIAGWWVWGVNAWIGSGWCSGSGPWGNAGQGVRRKRPHLGNAGKGVHRQLPHLGNAGQKGYNTMAVRHEGLHAYFARLMHRLRDVRVCCGDWSRVVTEGALAHGATVGVFLDPPYSGEVRTKDLYSTEGHDVAEEVRAWAIENGGNPRYRIVLAGYASEHAEAMPSSWRLRRYTKNVAYQTATSSGGNRDNRKQECLWFSPHCLDPAPGLFDGAAA